MEKTRGILLQPGRCRRRAKTLTFCNISYYLRYLLETRSMCSLSKEKSIRSRETIQNAFFSELCPFFDVDIFDILPTKILTLNSGMCSLSKEQFILSRKTIQNVFVFRIMPFFDLDFLSSIKQPTAERWPTHAMLLFDWLIDWLIEWSYMYWGLTQLQKLRSCHDGRWRICVSWLSHTSTNATFFPKPSTTFLTCFKAEVRG